MDVVGKIEALFQRRGSRPYEDGAHGGITVLAHALQCAQLAEWAHADPALVAAALLHDLGQLMDAGEAEPLQPDAHEQRGLALLSTGFGSGVLEPIRLQPAARRYLASMDARQTPHLSPGAAHRLQQLGGRMNAEEGLMFLARPQASAAVQLCRWDQLACHPGKRTPPLGYYLGQLEALLPSFRAGPARLAIA